MRTFRWLFLLMVTVLISVACKTQAPPPPPSDYRLTSSIRDIMGAMVDPQADIIWESVAEITNASGTEQRMPRTDEEWATVRHAAITILEATNLLLMEGRQVAAPGQKSANPNVELEPDEIYKRINADRAQFTKFVHALHDSVMVSFKAINNKDVKGLLDSGSGIDEACENCHLTYWYPKGGPPTAGAPAPETPAK